MIAVDPHRAIPRPEVEARRADRRRKAAELADRVIASAASDGVAAMQELDCLRGEYEDRRVALVTALNLPPETTWADALARVVPVPVEPVGAKGCHGCGFSNADECHAPGSEVCTWITEHLSHADYMTPKPGAPECPGRVQKEP